MIHGANAPPLGRVSVLQIGSLGFSTQFDWCNGSTPGKKLAARSVVNFKPAPEKVVRSHYRALPIATPTNEGRTLCDSHLLRDRFLDT